MSKGFGVFNFYLKKRDPDTAAPENWRERAMLSIAAVWPCAGGAGSLVFNFPVSACFFFLLCLEVLNCGRVALRRRCR